MKRASSKERIVRRAAREVHDGFFVNLGIGMPTLVANHVPDDVDIVLQSDNGMRGTGPFPFEGDRKSKKKIKVWGKEPEKGTLKVQEEKGSKWKTIDRFKVKESKVFYKTVKLKGKAKIRGELKGDTTRPWSQKK